MIPSHPASSPSHAESLDLPNLVGGQSPAIPLTSKGEEARVGVGGSEARAVFILAPSLYQPSAPFPLHNPSHAESLDLPHLVGGQSPAIPLTSKGREQGEALGRYLLEFQGVMFDEVFASPIPRAWETAYATCQELGFPPSRMQEAEELKEQSCGQWEGKNRADVFPTDASLPRITSAQPDFFCPGGESQRQ
ncbi:unnamed protein product, partial [Closterium sp. Naga37s-1]